MTLVTRPLHFESRFGAPVTREFTQHDASAHDEPKESRN